MPNCIESFGNKVETSIASVYSSIGGWVGTRPKKTIALCLLLTILCGIGFLRWETENRSEELWVPQNTVAETETQDYEQYFQSTSRFNNMIVQRSTAGANILTKDTLLEAMEMHTQIETKIAAVDDKNYALLDLCVRSGGACATEFTGVCQCLVTSILKQWNYNMATLENDDDVLSTINSYGTREDLEAVLGDPVFDENDLVISAEAFTLSYFLEDRAELKDGSLEDPVNEGWEEDVFLAVAQSVPETYKSLSVDYFASRSFSDEFGGAITGDLLLVNISYVLAFLFLAATMGKLVCGQGSRWTLALGALVAVGLATAAGFGLSSAFGLFFGPVHSLLPFILLGIGVDDAFVIVNAFNRERNVKRSGEDDAAIGKRSGRALARAGASITVTSLTDLVAFAISSASKLPALASFCGYAAISIFFLWLFASTFFSATMVLDERRQRDNRRECLCCVTRKKEVEVEEGFKEGLVSRYFRNYHAPAILSKWGKIIVLAAFSGLIAFGIYGAINLSVEDTEREFVPADSYLQDYFESADDYFPSTGVDLFITFEDGSQIYENRQSLSGLENRLTGLSGKPPFIGEPISAESYRNVMDGLYDYLVANGSGDIGGVTLGDDNWPINEKNFTSTLSLYASSKGPGAIYAQDIAYSGNGLTILAYRVKCEYVRLTKVERGETIDDADKQIDAMDATRELVESWTDLQPAFPYSPKFIAIESFKIIQQELWQNVGLAIAAVGVIVFITIASPVTALLITLNVACCIVEILGCMWALGIAIDSVSVINIVLAVGLSVDYSAHVGHCFMTKGGTDKNKRALESLADIGAAVLQGATSTFLAVVVLLFSSSYVFKILSKQFAITVALGVLHGLVLLPVLLSLVGPGAFASAEIYEAGKEVSEIKNEKDATGHAAIESSSSDKAEQKDVADESVEQEA